MTTNTETSARTQYRLHMERATQSADLGLVLAVQSAKGAAAIALVQLRHHEADAADWSTDPALVAHERLCASLWRSWYGRALVQADALDQQLRAAWRAVA